MDWPHVAGLIATGFTSLGLGLFAYWQSRDRTMLMVVRKELTAEEKHSARQDKQIADLQDSVKICDKERADLYVKVAELSSRLAGEKPKA